MKLEKERPHTSIDLEIFTLLAELDENYWRNLEGFKVYTKKWGEGYIKEITIEDNIKILVSFLIDGKTVDKLFSQEAIKQSFYKLEGIANWQEKNILKAIYKQKLYEYDLLRHDKMNVEENLNDLRLKQKEFKKLINNLRGSYYSHCFKCNDEVTDELERCDICGWFKCKRCGSCGCNFWKHDTVSLSPEEKQYTKRLKSITNNINKDEVEVAILEKKIEKFSELLNALRKRIS